MFFKQSGYKPRTLSGSSGTSGTQATATANTKDDNTTTGTGTNKTAAETTGPAASAGAAGRRRSSASSDTKFAGLQAYKRNSVDERKSNWAEQKPGSPGMLQGMWNSFTKGT